jgi:enoyl-CoA hydratase/carnithine racemase
MDSQPILFKELNLESDGSKAGLVELNRPKALNALNHQMIKLLSKQLSDWEHNDNIKLIILTSTSNRFCAGGDIKEAYFKLTEGNTLGVQQFIADEYKLDYQIYTYCKPIISLGSGIIMGGGLGLFAASQVRLLTSDTILAMPETKIGLYPDVGATYFLVNKNKDFGLFAGLTSATLNSADALQLNICDLVVDSYTISSLIEVLTKSNIDLTDKNEIISLLNSKLKTSELPKSNLSDNEVAINSIVAKNNFEDIINSINNHKSDNEWFNSCKQNLTYSSPTSQYITYETLTKSGLSRAEVMKLETKISISQIISNEFKEGVRALLIDKDKTPAWKPNSINKIDKTKIKQLTTIS